MKRLLLLIFMFVITHSSTYSQNQMTPEKAKAYFSFNFMRLMEWKDTDKSKDLNIIVYGDSYVYYEFKKYTTDKTIANKKILVEKTNDFNGIVLADINVVFISKRKSIPESLINNKNIVLIGDSESDKKLLDIVLIIDNEKMSFTINKTNLSKKNINISTLLYNRASNVF